jgi:hypothetical protein
MKDLVGHVDLAWKQAIERNALSSEEWERERGERVAAVDANDRTGEGAPCPYSSTASSRSRRSTAGLTNLLPSRTRAAAEQDFLTNPQLHRLALFDPRKVLMRTTHGATNELQIVRRATVEKRRLLRQIGLRASDLESVGRALLTNWARAAAAPHEFHALAHGWLATRVPCAYELAAVPCISVLSSARRDIRISRHRCTERPGRALKDGLYGTRGPRFKSGRPD